MPLTEQQIRELFNRCDPEEPLEPGDSRNLDIEKDHRETRGEPWVSRMARQIERSNSPVMLFFSGLRGSGKSTELRRLAARLEGKHILPILIDAEQLINISSTIDIPDVLTMILDQTERELLRREGKNPDEAMKESAIQRIWNYLSRTDIELTKFDLGPSVLGKFSGEMRTNPGLRERVRMATSKHLGTFIQEVFKEFAGFKVRAEALQFEQMTVIVDSLEKLQGTSHTWKDVLDSAERIFANDAPFLKLPVHVVYTFPPALTRRLKTEVVHLPMLKLRDRGGKDFPAGFDTVRELIRRRIPDGAMNDIFGPVNAEARIRELIKWSGGYPRELVRYLQAILTEEVFPISERGLQKILRSTSRPYARLVLSNEATIALVARVSETKSITTSSKEEEEILDLLLNNSIVFRYSNDEDWEDVHPAVALLEEVQEAIRRRNLPPAAPASA
jgi:hypothetical protein